ncbi:MAG: RNA polymerase sigma factor [Candidatus Marinimicrobia bacterium]|nr:RNA polymerase sigma factor [Candidatus Neomarinimicrobiota bacterium]MDD5582058.1 RNA polymerase sigma factor [Candidatus Neomarinimicrobiota bacterium]
MDEREIIRRAQEGNMAAFEQIVRTYEKKVLYTALQICRNQQDAEDITQDVFLSVYKNIPSFRFEASFYSWLYRITLNTAFNHTRQCKHEEFLTNNDDENRYLDISEDNSEDFTESKNFQEILEQIVRKLPEKQKIVLVMRYSQHLKIKEIALILGIGEGTVKKYLFRAQEKLRNALNPYKNKHLKDLT